MPEINTLSEIEMLDIVLNWFADGSREGFHKDTAITQMLNKSPALNTARFEEWINMIFAKLVKDEYLKANEKNSQVTGIRTVYSITFEGKLFHIAGGYKEQERVKNINLQKLKVDESIRKRNEKLTVWGTWVVGLGAISLVVWEMYKHYFLHID